MVATTLLLLTESVSKQHVFQKVIAARSILFFVYNHCAFYMRACVCVQLCSKKIGIFGYKREKKRAFVFIWKENFISFEVKTLVLFCNQLISVFEIQEEKSGILFSNWFLFFVFNWKRKITRKLNTIARIGNIYGILHGKYSENKRKILLKL